MGASGHVWGSYGGGLREPPPRQVTGMGKQTGALPYILPRVPRRRLTTETKRFQLRTCSRNATCGGSRATWRPAWLTATFMGCYI